MRKKIAASLIVALSLCTTSVYADYVDTSNRMHADQNNEIIASAFIPQGNTVIIYLENESGIDYDLGSDKNNFSIPFVKVTSVKAEKKKLDEDGRYEVDSEFYNKITLKVSSTVHDKQRFIIINDFKDANGENVHEQLLHSIAPRGEKKAPKYQASEKASDESTEDSSSKADKAAQSEKKEVTMSSNAVAYDNIASCVATDSEHIRLDFADGVMLDKENAEDYRSYNLVSESGQKLYVLKAALLSPNQVILQTQVQETNERFTLTADWIEAGENTSWFVYSNAVN